jgi:hypothetical protein
MKLASLKLAPVKLGERGDRLFRDLGVERQTVALVVEQGLSGTARYPDRPHPSPQR